jgi:hypothetical protein
MRGAYSQIDVRPQYLRARQPTNEAESTEYAANFGDGGPIWKEVDHEAKVIRFKRQTINKYTPTRTDCAPSGRSKRLKQRMRYLKPSMGATDSPECVPGYRHRRLRATRQFDGGGTKEGIKQPSETRINGMKGKTGPPGAGIRRQPAARAPPSPPARDGV